MCTNSEVYSISLELSDWNRVMEALRFRAYELLQRYEKDDSVYGQVCYEEHQYFSAIADSIEFKLPYEDD